MRAKIRAWRLSVPLKVRHRVDVAELSRGYAVAQVLQHRHETPPESDLELESRGAHQHRGLFSFGRRDADRLFAQRGHPRFDKSLDGREVHVARYANQHRV